MIGILDAAEILLPKCECLCLLSRRQMGGKNLIGNLLGLRDRAAFRQLLIGLEDFAEHDVDRPTIQDHVMVRPDETHPFRRKPEEGESHQRGLIELEIEEDVFIREQLDLTSGFFFVEPAQIGDVPRDIHFPSHQLHRVFQSLPNHEAPQHGVAGDHCLPRLLKQLQTDIADESAGELLHVHAGLVGQQRVIEDALLRRCQPKHGLHVLSGYSCHDIPPLRELKSYS